MPKLNLPLWRVTCLSTRTIVHVIKADSADEAEVTMRYRGRYRRAKVLFDETITTYAVEPYSAPVPEAAAADQEDHQNDDE